MPARPPSAPPRLIKRYDNRKLYDAGDRRYVCPAVGKSWRQAIKSDAHLQLFAGVWSNLRANFDFSAARITGIKLVNR